MKGSIYIVLQYVVQNKEIQKDKKIHKKTEKDWKRLNRKADA